MKTLLLCLTVAVAIGLVYGDLPKYADSIMTRATGAKGVLLCGKLPAKNARVRLFRKESDDPKEILDYKITGDDGRFEVEGNTADRTGNETNIEPVLKIYHKCDEKEEKKGYRRFVIKYPSQFVTLGRIARSHYNVGTLNLEVIYPNEGREKNFVEGNAKNI
uniref:Transthyretin-like family protein n=1 Tax=Steinernema glaseri TaxID=37863 RepID=A0A1I7YRP9_9BILA